MPILQVIDVHKQYGASQARVHALRGVNLAVRRGEFLAVMGPSGCGKSTLLQLMGGIDAPTSGQILLEGVDLAEMSDASRSLIRRHRIGFVFQKINLLSTLSAVENVALPLRIGGRPRSQAIALALAALERVGLADRAKHLPHELSGGEQQRVAIARALLIDPALILADEPTGALDSANARVVSDLLRRCASEGRTIVMVTHDVQLASQADRTVTMGDGQLLTGAPSAAVCAGALPQAPPAESPIGKEERG